MQKIEKGGEKETICGIEKEIKSIKKYFTTIHVCKLKRGHKGKHACVKISETGQKCSYMWRKNRK